MNKQEFINLIAPKVQRENNKRGNPLFSSIVIAQACLETGFGKSETMMKYNAIFGIKATLSWNGKSYNARTKEFYDGNVHNITDCFRAYNNLEESISDYFDLITKNSRYRNACISETPFECISAIKNGGYATEPNYVSLVMQIIEQNNLKKYDEKTEENFFEIGKVYTLQVDLNVRENAGTQYKVKNYNDLTVDGKNHAYIQTKAVLKKGTHVTCKEVIEENGNIWLKIPSGYIAGYYKGKEYVK